MNDINELLSNAKLSTLSKGSTFIASIVFSLNHVVTDKVPTAATNGTVVKYNPDFFAGLSTKERVFLVLHETWHVAFLHMTRRGDRDPTIWNMAGDYVINLLLVEAGFTMPKGGLLDKRYSGLSTEEVYNLIKDNSDSSSPEFFPNDLDEKTEQELKELEQDISSILVKAKSRSELSGEGAGSVPDEMKRLIEELTNPKLPWNELLSRFLSEKVKEDYSWAKPNRRYLARDIVLPSLHSEGLGHIAIAIDTSGSVSKKELTELLSEIKYIYETMQPSKLTIMDCDYAIHNIYEVENGEDILDLEFSGGGGTRFSPVFEKLKDKPIQALIYFTDLYAQQITEEPPFPVMWICTGNHEPAPIGETIYLN